MKKRKYDHRIRDIDYGCFSPLIFSTSDGHGSVSTVVYKHIAQLQSEKFQKPYNSLINFIHCKLSLSILRSTIRCLRDTRSTFLRA